MTDLELLLPRANAPIAGNLPATREFYDFLRELIVLAGQEATDDESIESLAARVLALEQSGSGNQASIIGLGQVLVTGSLQAGEVVIQLTGAEQNACSVSGAFSGGTADIVVGTFCDVSIPTAFDIVQATLIGDPSGNLTVDVRAADLSMFPPGPSDTICGGNPPELTGGDTYQDATLAGWTKAVPVNSVIRFIVTACSGVKNANLVLYGNRNA